MVAILGQSTYTIIVVSWKCNFLLPWDECCLLTTNINTIIISWRCAQLILDSTSALISFSLVFGANSLVIVLASK